MTVSDANIVLAIQALTSFSVQTSAEATAGTNTAANILHATASRTQGCYTVFKAIAQEVVTRDLLRVGKTATDAWSERAMALLVGDLQEKKDPDWAARSISFDGYSVSRITGAQGEGGPQTGYMQAYHVMLDSLSSVDSGAFGDQDENGIVRTKDAEDYPDSWRLSGLDADSIDPF